MARIKIVTDSASDLPDGLAARESISIVPLDVRLEGLAPGALRGASGQQFWEAVAASPDLAETAAPSPGQFQEAFLAALAEGYDVVCCITISSGLSATYQSACTAASAVADRIAVEVVDSRLATMGEGLLVLDAVERAVVSGGEVAELAGALRQEAERITVFGTLDTLDNLRRGGRIGSAQALFGSLLSIKPVVEIRDGVVEGESRTAHAFARSLQYLVDKVRTAGELKRLAVVHAAADDLEVFLGLLAEVYPPSATLVSYVGPVIGTHTGKGTIGVCLERA